MSFRENTKHLARRLAEIRYVGRLVKTSIAVWRTPQTKATLDRTQAMLNETQKKLQTILDGYGDTIRGIGNITRKHEISLGSLKSFDDEKISYLDNQIRQILEKLGWIEIDNNNIRSRIEFIRKETLFELRKQLRINKPFKADLAESIKPIFVNKEKINNLKLKKLNLGCGHIAKEEYINVDGRELPGVDLISDVTALPFEKESVDSIYAAHLIEHFSERTLKDIVLPHWFEILKVKGEIVLIAPNAEAMIHEYVKKDCSFQQLHEVIFGGQEYDGDFHLTMLTPESSVKLLKEIGFSEIKIMDSNRRNGDCFEFEIHAKK